MAYHSTRETEPRFQVQNPTLVALHMDVIWQLRDDQHCHRGRLKSAYVTVDATSMTPFTFFLLLFALWSSIHLVHRFYVPASKSRGILPTSLTPRRRTTTTVAIAGPYLRIESTAFNSGHDILAQWFSRNRISRVHTTLRVVFDSGIVISLLGMVFALAVLLWTFVQLARKSVADLVPPSAGVYPHAKRAYDSIYVPPTVTQSTTTEADIPVQLLVSTSYLSISFLHAYGETSYSPTDSDSRHHPPNLTFPSTHKCAVLLASYT
jgi:hypothetical protein